MMKLCVSCENFKGLNSFRKDLKSKDGRQDVCNKCSDTLERIEKRPEKRQGFCIGCGKRLGTKAKSPCEECIIKNKQAYEKKKRTEKKTKISLVINAIKNNPCSDCGNKFPPCAMDFDHIKGEKKFNISSHSERRLSTNRLIKELLEEIEKCELVCANCHRVRTFNRRQN